MKVMKERVGYDMPQNGFWEGINNAHWLEQIVSGDLLFDYLGEIYVAKKQKQKKEHQNKYSTDGSKMSKPAPKQKKKKK